MPQGKVVPVKPAMSAETDLSSEAMQPSSTNQSTSTSSTKNPEDQTDASTQTGSTSDKNV